MNCAIRLWTYTITASIVLIFGTALISFAQPTPGLVGSKTLLDTINLSAWNPHSIVVSKNIQSVAYIQHAANKKVQVVRNGQPGTPFDAIKQDSLVFSTDGQRLAYEATRGKHQVMVIDEEINPGYKKILDGSFIFSPDGKHYAYAAKTRKSFAVINGKQSMPYRRIVPFSLQFSPDSNSVAYIANDGSKQVMVIDGEVSPRYDNIWIGSSIFSSSGTRSAYVTQIGNTWSVTIDKKKGPSFDFIVVSSLQFSKDGQHTSYIAQSGGKSLAVRDGIPGAPLDQIRAQSLVFSPNGNHLAYAANIDGDWTPIVDGKTVGQPFDDIDGIQPSFSPDGSQLAFGVRLGKQWGVVVDGTLGIPHTNIGHDTFRFSPNNQHFAYVANLEGSWFMMLDGKPDAYAYGRKAVENLSYTRLGIKGPVFSPDGKRLAYSVAQGNDKLGVVVDGQLGRPHWTLIEESLVFSPDGKKLAYVAGSSDGKWRVLLERKVSGHAYDGVGMDGVLFSSDSEHALFIAQRNHKWMAVVDGQEGELFDHLLVGKDGPLHLTPSNELRYIGRQGDKIYLLEIKVGAV